MWLGPALGVTPWLVLWGWPQEPQALGMATICPVLERPHGRDCAAKMSWTAVVAHGRGYLGMTHNGLC